jgi:hypothetical protein
VPVVCVSIGSPPVTTGLQAIRLGTSWAWRLHESLERTQCVARIAGHTHRFHHPAKIRPHRLTHLADEMSSCLDELCAMEKHTCLLSHRAAKLHKLRPPQGNPPQGNGTACRPGCPDQQRFADALSVSALPHLLPLPPCTLSLGLDALPCVIWVQVIHYQVVQCGGLLHCRPVSCAPVPAAASLPQPANQGPEEVSPRHDCPTRPTHPST